jgi:hypothetical protein
MNKSLDLLKVVENILNRERGKIDGNNEFWELYNYPFLEDALGV